MDINALIEQYGYAALVIGSVAEGETITLLGGVAAHQGLLKFPLVVAAVALGGMIGDQLLYFLGLRFGPTLLKRFAKHKKKINRAQRLIQRHPYLFVIGTRFMYGFRIIGPILIGASRLPPKIFLPLNILFVGWQKLLTKIFHLEPSAKMSQEELLTLVNEVQEDGTIDEDEGGLLRNAIEFSDQEARDILIHRTDLAALPITATKDEIAEMFTETKFSRLLIYRDTIDDILGTIHRKDFYVGRGITEKEVKDIISPAIYVLESEPIRMILKKQQKAKTHVAVVVDEYGGTCGIVTMEDILEELVGEIWDEHDEVTEDFRKQSDGSWIVLGSAGVDDLYERLGLPEDEDIDSNTVNGLVQEKTCRLPKVGDRFTLGSYDGVVTRTAKRRVTEVRLTPAEKPETKKDEEEKGHFGRMTSK